ncbi:MAG TPA: tetratricopeptide repeat protein [Lacunisphaera sp.]|nr:tetratricopeptide repeat protein [Lacunisphaera sp.]
MIKPPSAESPSQNQPAPAAASGLEDGLHSFWEQNRKAIFVLCVVALLAVIGREGWQFVAAQHEQDVRQAYAKAADRPEQLAAFAAANQGHVLSGIAYLRVADAKYTAGDFRAAAENYAKAAAGLTQPALLGRAKIGAAMSQLNGADKAAGEAALKAISNDMSMPKAARVEATYHLATLASEAGNTAEVSRLAVEAGKIDATSSWARNATALLRLKPAS